MHAETLRCPQRPAGKRPMDAVERMRAYEKEEM